MSQEERCPFLEGECRREIESLETVLLGPESEANTPLTRAANLRAQIKEAGSIINLRAAACFFGIGVDQLTRLGEQDQHPARFLVGLVAAEQMNQGKNLDDLTLNSLELQTYALITAGNLNVPLPNLARAAAGR